MDGNRLLKVIGEVAKKGSEHQADLVYGEVINLNPLQIKVDNRFIIGSEFITLSALCRDHTIIVNIAGEDSIIEIWKGLRLHDKVRMLRVHEGQMFYVIEKEGGLNT